MSTKVRSGPGSIEVCGQWASGPVGQSSVSKDFEVDFFLFTEQHLAGLVLSSGHQTVWP